MNRLNLSHIVTSVIIIFVQILLLRNIQITIFDRYTLVVMIYPAVIILLPLGIRRSVVIISAFFVGLFIDMFYDSPGVHTAALVFTAFLRTIVLGILEPRQGYRTNETPSPKAFGMNWFLTYVGIVLFLHIFTYFSVDAFTYVFFIKILVNSILSFFVSFLVIILYKMLL